MVINKLFVRSNTYNNISHLIDIKIDQLWLLQKQVFSLSAHK